MIFGLSQQTHRAYTGSRLKLPNTLPVLRYDYMYLLDFCEKKICIEIQIRISPVSLQLDLLHIRLSVTCCLLIRETGIWQIAHLRWFVEFGRVNSEGH